MNAPPIAKALPWALAVAIALLVAPLAGQNASGEEHEVVEVTITRTDDPDAEFAFEPDVVTIKPGTTVRWVHDHDVFHTVTSTDSQEKRTPNDRFDETFASEGDTFEYTFDESGEFHYYCKPHSNFMFGTVIVEGEESAPGLPVGVLLGGMVALLWVARRR